MKQAFLESLPKVGGEGNSCKTGGKKSNGGVDLSPFLVSLMALAARAAVDTKLKKSGGARKKRGGDGESAEPVGVLETSENVSEYSPVTTGGGARKTKAGRKKKGGNSEEAKALLPLDFQ